MAFIMTNDADLKTAQVFKKTRSRPQALIDYDEFKAFGGATAESSSPTTRGFDFGNVDFPHSHHRCKGALGLRAARRHRAGEDAGRDRTGFIDQARKLNKASLAGARAARRMASSSRKSEEDVSPYPSFPKTKKPERFGSG
jgi:hypothetical protein